jgi:hypothetical protein
MEMTMDKKVATRPVIPADLFQSDEPLGERLQGLLNLIAFKATRVENTGLDDMDDYFARATDYLGQLRVLEREVQVLRDAVEHAD